MEAFEKRSKFEHLMQWRVCARYSEYALTGIFRRVKTDMLNRQVLFVPAFINLSPVTSPMTLV